MPFVRSFSALMLLDQVIHRNRCGIIVEILVGLRETDCVHDIVCMTVRPVDCCYVGQTQDAARLQGARNRNGRQRSGRLPSITC